LKSKFISLIVSVAVIVGLMLVPAMPTVLGALNEWAFEIQNDAVTKVTPGSSFTVEIAAVQLVATQSDGWEAYLTYDPALLNVTGIDIPATLPPPNSGAPDKYPAPGIYDMANPGYNNTEGILYAGYSPQPSSPKLNATFVFATIHFTAAAINGSATTYLNFTNPDAFHSTAIYLGSTHLEKWSSFVDGTVMIGSPVLTVDVNPADKGDVEVDGVLAGPYPDDSTWDWDEVVPLDAVDSEAGWTFFNWTGDVANASAASTTVTMDDHKTVVANFVELPCDLDVDPNHLDLTARWSAVGYEDSDTVTIANDGGHTVCWALGSPPDWTPGDNWSYMNTYDEAPPGNPFPNPYYSGMVPCPVNNSLLVMDVTGEDADNYYVTADWPLGDPQRTINATDVYGPGAYFPCCLHHATAVIDKCTLDYVSQLANLTAYTPGPLPTQALVTWDYDSCHGWPYYLGKAWNYNVTVVDAVHPGGKTTAARAMVTNVSQVIGPFPDCYEITHWVPNFLPPDHPSAVVFMQQWWSDTARNFVYQWDGGTFNAPPLDIRQYAGQNPAPALPPAVGPSWLSFDKTHGTLGIGDSELLTVTANSSGLNVTTHSGNFTISACCGSIQDEIVTVDFVVTPATTLEDVVRDLPADRLLPDAEYPGMTFDVYVNFSAPVADFNSIGVTDFAPAGWLVETNSSWCYPPASYNKSNYNKAEYAWAGPYDPPQNFSAMYKVTIPATATAGSNFWPNCTSNPCPPCEGSPINLFPAWVEYWFGATGPFETVICEEREKVVTVPGCVVGETRDVNADLLDTVTVVLYEEPLDADPEDSDSSSLVPISTIPAPEHASVEGGTFSEDPTTWYENCADDTGYYYQVASKYCYYTIDSSNMSTPRNFSHPDYIDWSTPEKLADGYRMDFEADYGLVCMAASMSYAMESINHWLFVPIDGGGIPHPEWQLHSWKAMESIHSWQFPCGCGCG